MQKSFYDCYERLFNLLLVNSFIEPCYVLHCFVAKCFFTFKLFKDKIKESSSICLILYIFFSRFPPSINSLLVFQNESQIKIREWRKYFRVKIKFVSVSKFTKFIDRCH